MQMMYKCIAVLAIAASHIATASACGWGNDSSEKCCNVADNNPNIGDCHEDRAVCWEGYCMMCGVDGKPTCPSTPLHSYGAILVGCC